jgi:FAD/FMN-containing dehydrogenase
VQFSYLKSIYNSSLSSRIDSDIILAPPLGIVTKIGIQMIPAPEAYATVEVDVPQESDLVALVSILSDLMRRSVILNSPSIANIFRIALTSRVASVQGKVQGYMKPHSYVPYDVLEEIRVEQKWGFWRAYFSLYSQVELLPGLLQTTRRAFNAIPGATMKWREFPGTPGESITTATIKEEEIPHSGIPTLAPLAILNSRQKPGSHIDYSPLFPPSGRELYEWYLKAKQRTVDAKFDFFADFHVFPRHVIGIELIIYTDEEAERVDQLMRHVIHDAADMGYTAYRTHLDYMDEVASHFNFNGGALKQFTTKLKDFLDPRGILSPGKSGIWPSGTSSVDSKPQM